MSALVQIASTHLGFPDDVAAAFTKHLRTDGILGIGLRLALTGLIAAGFRSAYIRGKSWLSDVIFPKAYIPATDPAFAWIMSHLAQQPLANELSTFRILTADQRESKRDDIRRRAKDPETKKNLLLARDGASFAENDVVGQIVPVNEKSVFVKHEGQYIWIKRSDVGFAQSQQKETDHLQVSSFILHKNAIKDFLLAAHASFFKKSDSEILIFHNSPFYGGWYEPISRPARTWNSVILPQEIKDTLIDDVKGFLSEEEREWYAERATAIASQLKLDIYVVNPAARGMDDNKLSKAFRSCPPGSMILIEDIDCAMPKRRNEKENDRPEDEDDEANEAESGNADPGKYGLAKSTVTLSGLLNAIDGVSSQEDCILFATTNHPNRLDHALSRPGRFDVKLSFFDATPGQAKELFKHFYHARGRDECDDDDDNAEKDLGLAKLDDQAHVFAKAVFDDLVLINGEDVKISMAALQGFLLQHKKDGDQAVEGARVWAEGVKAEQEERLRVRLEKKARREEAPLIPVSA